MSAFPGEDPALRENVREEDTLLVRQLVESTGFFRPDEVEIAVELVQERLAQGMASGYHFLFAEIGAELVGYTCYGPIAGTRASYDLFWIAVRKEEQRLGLGRFLVHETERRIGAQGGQRIYVETSSQDLYEPTRAFYRKQGYVQAALLEDFYQPGDGKVIFVKAL